MKYIIPFLLLLAGCATHAEVQIHGTVNESFTSQLMNETDQLLTITNTTKINDTPIVYGTAESKIFPPVRKVQISLYGVDEEGTQCGIQVNDKRVWIDESGKATVDGIKIHVFDVIAVRSKTDPGLCEVLIGGKLFYLT